MFKSKFYRIPVIFIMILSIMGMSSHYRNWTDYTSEISRSLAIESKDLEKAETIYLWGETYSKIGELNHLPLGPVLDFSKVSKTIILNRGHKIDDNQLVNLQYNTREPLQDQYYVYDTTKRKLESVSVDQFSEMIATAPVSIRHWSQALPKDNWLQNLIFRLKPSLAFER